MLVVILKRVGGQQITHQFYQKISEIILFAIDNCLVKKNPNILDLKFEYFKSFFFQGD